MGHFDLCSLAERRNQTDLFSILNVVNKSLDCPDVLFLIKFNFPSTTISIENVFRMYQRTNYYLKLGPISRLNCIGLKRLLQRQPKIFQAETDGILCKSILTKFFTHHLFSAIIIATHSPKNERYL